MYNDIMTPLYTNYGRLDNETKQLNRHIAYKRLVENILHGMFKSEVMPYDTKRLFEHWLIHEGYVALGTVGGEVAVGFPTDIKGIDDNGVPIIKGGVTTFNGKKMDNVVLIGNNATFTPDTLITDRFCYELAKVERSEDNLIKNSVCNPIPFASSDNVKNGIVKALKNSGMDEEEINVILSTPYNLDNADSYKDFDVLNLTDVSYSDKFKYISEFNDYLMRQLYFFLGMPTQSPTKQAQTNNPELQNRDTSSMIYPTERLKARVEGFRKFEELTGIVIDYEFADLWQTIDHDAKRDNIIEEEEESADAEEVDEEGKESAENDDI